MWKLYKKYWLVALIVIACGISIIPFKQVPNEEKGKQLIIGLQSGYPPFEFVDGEGTLIGFDVDIAQLIADKLDKELVINDREFEGLILSLKQGKMDLILSGMNITPSRLKEIHLIPYHGETMTHLSLIFWGERPKGIDKLEDFILLPKSSISVQSGSIAEAYLSKIPAIKVKSLQGALAPLIDVKYGKSTASLVESDVAVYLQGQHPEITLINVPLPLEEQILGFGIGIRKGNQELFDQVSAVIQELKASGELKKLEDKWFKEDKAPQQTSGGSLLMGCPRVTQVIEVGND